MALDQLVTRFAVQKLLKDFKAGVGLALDERAEAGGEETWLHSLTSKPEDSNRVFNFHNSNANMAAFQRYDFAHCVNFVFNGIIDVPIGDSVPSRVINKNHFLPYPECHGSTPVS